MVKGHDEEVIQAIGLVPIREALFDPIQGLTNCLCGLIEAVCMAKSLVEKEGVVQLGCVDWDEEHCGILRVR